MAKIPFTKLGLKKLDEIEKIKINDIEIEVKKYLPVNDKLELATKVLNEAHDTNNFSNPIKSGAIMDVEIVDAYTNISFTDKQKEDIWKLYDLLQENGIIEKVIQVIPFEEYGSLVKGIEATIDAYYSYENSIYGILDTVSKDYSNLELDAEKLRQDIADPNSIALLKDITTKLR